MNILKIFKETTADGPGLRYTIYVAGCDLRCPGCHNPESWSFEQGTPLSPAQISSIAKDLDSNPLLAGLTITGGDPLHFRNAVDLYKLLLNLQSHVKHTIVYTGHLAEQLIDFPQIPEQKLCLSMIDMLVDGPYLSSQRDLTDFRGSSNQRFIQTRLMAKNGNLHSSMISNYTREALTC